MYCNTFAFSTLAQFELLGTNQVYFAARANGASFGFEALKARSVVVGRPGVRPIAAVKSGRPAIVIAPSGRTLASVAAAVADVRERGSEVMAISDDPEFLAAADTAFPLVPGVPEWLSPILTVVPGQAAAVRLATLQGANVDSPAELTKITLPH